MTGRAIIGIVGAGLMGHGIAQVFARAGHRVKVFDAVPAALASLRARIAANLAALDEPVDCVDLVTGHGDLADAVGDADLVVEAAPEKLDVKRALFAELVRLAPRRALIASNTSVIPIGEIVAGLPGRERLLGTHWWNPPFLVPLVEVVGTPDTAPETIEWTIDLLRAVGKTPVHVKKDVPGFVGNRLQHALWREAIALVAEGICDAETVDTVVKASFGRRLAVLGPLENADLVGTDLTLDIHDTVIRHLDRSEGPNPYLRTLVETGKLGTKTGSGFRSWKEGEPEALRARVFRHLEALNASEQSLGGDHGREDDKGR